MEEPDKYGVVTGQTYEFTIDEASKEPPKHSEFEMKIIPRK
jgi:hypothetical protein